MTRSARILFDFETAVVLLENPTGQALVGAPVANQQRIAEFAIPLGKGGGAVAASALERAWPSCAATARPLACPKNSCCACSAPRRWCACRWWPGRAAWACWSAASPTWQLPACQKRERFLQAFGSQAAGALETALSERGHARRQLASVAEEYREASRRVVHEVNNPLSIIKNYLSVLDSKLANARNRWSARCRS
jgi:hypothetical protein